MTCNGNLILKPCVYLDTWDGLSNCSFSSDGTAFASSLTLVRMFFRDEENAVGLELSSANSTITIDNAADWHFTIAPVSPMTLTPGNWYWSIETTDYDGTIKTRVFGTIEILNDATR
jgi:hypothetical protein